LLQKYVFLAKQAFKNPMNTIAAWKMSLNVERVSKKMGRQVDFGSILLYLSGVMFVNVLCFVKTERL
jgi:hypothetical protein